VIAYPPIKCIIKPEIPEEHQEVNTAEEENCGLQVRSAKIIFFYKTE